MPKNRGRGSRGVPRGPFRGRYRGSAPGRGRGRGAFHSGGEFADGFDYPVQIWPDVESERFVNRGSPSPRPNGHSTNNSGANTPKRGRGRGGRGRGDSPLRRSPRGFGSPASGRGRGRGGSKLKPDAPLSNLLYQERPFLRPVIFVPSLHTRVLFQEEEEIFKAVVEEVGDEEGSHVPTADRVARIFSGKVPQMYSSASDVDEKAEGSEQLEEIDFNDMARLRQEVDMIISSTTATKISAEMIEEQFRGVPIEVESTQITTTVTTATPQPQATSMPTQPPASSPSFYIDTEPTPPSIGSQDIAGESSRSLGFYVDTQPSPITQHSATIPDPAHLLGDPATGEPDEVIVYVAPHPRSGKSITPVASALTPPPVPSASTLTGSSYSTNSPRADTQPPATPPRTPIPAKTRQLPIHVARSKSKAKAVVRRQEARVARKRIERRGLRGGERKDPRWESRRRGDSDIDWGDGDGDSNGDNVGAEGMLLDPDLEIDMAAMARFANSMAMDGGQFVINAGIKGMSLDPSPDPGTKQLSNAAGDDLPNTMDENRDIENSGSEDEMAESGSTDEEEIDAIIHGEEVMMISEPQDVMDDASDDESSEEEHHSPVTGFQARLQRLRDKSHKRRPTHVSMDEDSTDDEDTVTRNLSWADEDESFIVEIQNLLDENQDILDGHNRKARNKIFRSIRNGEFEDVAGPSRPKNKLDKSLPPELQELWIHDRERKAERKRARERERLENAADPMSKKKGGKKGRKAMLAAARLDPTITVLPNRVIDMFIGDVGGPVSMSLPPTDRGTRKNIHEMALAFNLKSKSQGKGESRYTTLMKTTKTGFGTDERKIAKLVRRGGAADFVDYSGKGKGNATSRPVMPRHKDGDEVGKAAPKIGETNKGFRMLALMGWTEGTRIGVSGGIDVPLTAVIKNTKLGLGANK
ncbi:hypothetical protein BD779DRAFT_1507251 [Infundibulicybe gibba]|nr:hypothetical protein BD779DRAFT_1507251 [Infundibulicybe gibba]